MTKIILRFLFAAVITIAGSTFGYSQLTQSYQANVPFDFTIKDTTMKAGIYRVRPVLSGSGVGYLELIDVDHNRSRILSTLAESDYTWDSKATNKLTFVEDSGGYTLASVETATFRKRVPRITVSAQVITKNMAKKNEITVALK